MQDISQLKLMAMSLLQTCSYVTEQMQTPVTIDVNKFMESFSIKDKDGGDVHPPSWIAGKDDMVTFSPATAFSISQPGLLTGSPKPFTMDEYAQCRQAEAIRWINLQEKRASVIAHLQPVMPEEYEGRRKAVYLETGTLGRKSMTTCLSVLDIKFNIYIYIAPKRTTQTRISKRDQNTMTSLNNPSELLNRRQFLLLLLLLLFYFINLATNMNFRIKTETT
jgi:hypothetical protein